MACCPYPYKESVLYILKNISNFQVEDELGLWSLVRHNSLGGERTI